MLQDKEGLMWFGTRDGLNKYNGYAFKIYEFRHDDPHSLGHNYITALLEDAQGNLWVGTHGGGLNLYNRALDHFVRFTYDGSAASISDNMIWSIIQDKYNEIWVGTGHGLNNMDRETGEFYSYIRDSLDTQNPMGDIIRVLYEDSRGNLLTGTEQAGLFLYNWDEGVMKQYAHDPENPQSLSHNNVRAICEDEAGYLWIGTYGGGLNRFDLRTETFKRYAGHPESRAGLNDPHVLSMTTDPDGDLWIGTENGGLNHFDRIRQTFTHYMHVDFDVSTLSNNSIWSVYVDRHGNLWVGTFNGGVHLYERYRKPFRHVRRNPVLKNSISGNSVLSILQDAKRRLWIGTDNAGLSCFDPAAGSWKTFRHDPRNPRSLSHNSVLCLYTDRFNTLWAGTFAGGLNRYDDETGAFRHYRNDPDDPHSLNDNDVRAILEDSRGRVWIGTEKGGLNLFDRETGRARHYTEGADCKTLNCAHVRVLLEDDHGCLWVGTFGGGVNVLGAHADTFRTYVSDINDPASLSHNDVRTLFKDSRGRIWIGTAGGGLDLYRPDSDDFEIYRKRDGLPSNSVHGILEDAKGRLWLSTNKGLCEFDPNKRTFTHYDVDDGLQSKEFNHRACFKDQTGQLYFGGVNGYNVFHPDSIRQNPYIPPVILTEFKVFNRPLPINRGKYTLKRQINQVDTVTLSHRQSFFSIEFAALNYSSPEKNQYKYCLRGFDADWIEAGNSHTANYTNVGPGVYTFQVLGSNNDRVWNETGKSVVIRIIPPVYQTFWFRFWALFSLVFGITAVILSRFRREVLQKHKLERLVNERTRELQQTSDEWKQLAVLSNHEFREPLRNISGFSTLISRRYGDRLDAQGCEFIHLAVNAVKQMQQVIDDIHLFFQAATEETKRMRINSNKIVEKIIHHYAPELHAVRGEITHDPLPVISVEPSQFETLMQNLIRNAVQYSGEQPLRVHLAAIESNGMWRFTVKDNGIGIAPENREIVFHIFKRCAHFQDKSSTGIGLALCKKIVERHGGRIWVESEPGAGSTFAFTLPVMD